MEDQESAKKIRMDSFAPTNSNPSISLLVIRGTIRMSIDDQHAFTVFIIVGKGITRDHQLQQHSGTEEGRDESPCVQVAEG